MAPHFWPRRESPPRSPASRPDFGIILAWTVEDKLESAVLAPAATFGGEFLHSDISEMAATYLCSICSNHAFVDGNKRTAAVATMFFLRQNGVAFRPLPEEYESLVLGVAEGRAGKAEVVKFLNLATADDSDSCQE